MRWVMWAYLMVDLLGCSKKDAAKNDTPNDTKSKPIIAAKDVVGSELAKTNPTKSPPTPSVANNPRIVDIELGHYRGCALQDDGQVVCWGTMPTAEAGKGPPEAPTKVSNLNDAVQIAGDDGLWCARTKSGSVACWADGSMKAIATSIVNAVEINGSCARLAAGSVTCFSGIDKATPSSPKVVAGLTDIVALSKGGGPNCAIKADRTVVCWGPNNYHQLGDGTEKSSESPVTVKFVKGADEVGTSYFFQSCARSGSNVTCWGGEAGLKVPTPSSLRDVVQLAMGEYHACALLKNGTVQCWGSNSSGQLGVPSEEAGTTPVTVEGMTDVVQVAVAGGEPAGGAGSTAVRTKDGSVYLWGAMNSEKKPKQLALSPIQPGVNP